MNSASDGSPPLAAIRILLAEDDGNARETLADLLVSFGHIVVAAVGSGRDAIARARELGPDALLLDVHMPDGSGIEAASVIVSERPETAVVLFTGDPSLRVSSDEVTSTGAVAFLPKPTPPTLLDSTIRLAVARSRELSAARGDASAARRQLEERKLIERAKGILMRRTGSTEQEAYRILQRTSQDRSVSMAEIARAVIESEPGAGRTEG